MNTPRTSSVPLHANIPGREQFAMALQRALKKCSAKISQACADARAQSDVDVVLVPVIFSEFWMAVEPEAVAIFCLAAVGRGDAMAAIFAGRQCSTCQEIATLPHEAIIEGVRFHISRHRGGGIDCALLLEEIRRSIEP